MCLLMTKEGYPLASMRKFIGLNIIIQSNGYQYNLNFIFSHFPNNCIQFSQLVIDMSEYPNEHQLFTKLNIERHKQIMREGINITYRYTSYPYQRYFIFDLLYKSQLIELLKETRYPLQVCNEEGIPLMKVSSSDLFISRKLQDSGKLFISPQFFMSNRIINGLEYYLVKSNPTLNAYKNNLSEDQHLFTDLKFIESPNLIKYFKGETQEIQSKMPIAFPEQKDLNEAQNQAIRKSGMNALTFIKGPPGCGKTKTIARLCRLFLENNFKVIVGAVSNTGNLSIVRSLINELTLSNQHQQLLSLHHNHKQSNPQFYYYQLAQSYDKCMKYKLVFYPPFDLSEQDLPPLLQTYSYDTVLIKNMVRIVCSNHEVNEMQAITHVLYQYRLLKSKKTVDNRFYAILMQAVAMITTNAHIIVATTVKSKSINSKLDPYLHFQPNVAILDEASQSSISDTLCYLKLDIEKLILVGDEKQLAPTVITNDKLLKKSLFIQYGQAKKQYFTMLNIQYRMHPQISSLANQLFYDGQIKDGMSVFDRLSPYLPFSNHPVLFINSHYPEQQQLYQSHASNKKTYVNYYQIIIMKMYLMHIPVEQLKNVGIITPYADQAKLIVKLMGKEVREYGLTVKTCDGYQGGEKDYIFISLVRSNEDGNIGFCSEATRINVSITRAKRGLLIVGSASTFVMTYNYWGAIINLLIKRQVYFNYDIPIAESDILELMQLHKREEKEPEPRQTLLPQQGVIYYPQYEHYREQFLKQYPEQPEQTIQQHYNIYLSNLYYQHPYYSYNQPTFNNSEINRQAIVSALTNPAEESDGDQEEMVRFSQKNKAQVKKLRSLDFLRTTNNSSSLSPQEYLMQIQSIFSTISNDPQQLTKCLTKSIRQEYLPYFTEPKPNTCRNSLLELLTLIISKAYSQGQQNSSANIHTILFHSLLDRLYSYL